MSNETISFQLLFHSGGAPVLAKQTFQPQPGKRFSTFPKDTDKIYLAGGFSSCTNDTQIPLSPTLQLNGDLGNFDNDFLQDIGRAELNRINSVTYRSYEFEPDKRVLAVAKDDESLTKFLETYSGVLQIEPLLIGSFHPEYATAEELRIEPLTEGCQVKYLIRKPINIELCTYCGICGPICPEDCLDENLSIDLSQCTYCNECVKICSQQAIDLYRGEKFEQQFQAIVLLDQPKVDLPDDQSRIFNLDQLEDMFSTFIPLYIEETVAWTSSICQYSRRPETGCTICRDACKHSAIVQNQNGVVIDHIQCVECGACLASCPTGALQYRRFPDKQFIEWFNTVRLNKNTTLIIGDEEQLHSLWWKRNIDKTDDILFLEHPNTRALTSMHLLFLISLGTRQVILLDDPEKCQSKQIARQVEIANTVFNTLFKYEQSVIITQPSDLKNALLGAGTNPLQEQYKNFNFTNRRDKLGDILSFLLEQSATSGQELSGELYSSFGSVECDRNLCTHCGACLNDCLIEALKTDEQTLTLSHTGILCVQCNTCVDVCPEDALKLKPGLLLSQSFIAPKELTSAEPIKCQECGKPFGTKKSFERIVAILKAKKPEDTNEDILAYCEKCRVVKMFEANQQ